MDSDRSTSSQVALAFELCTTGAVPNAGKSVSHHAGSQLLQLQPVLSTLPVTSPSHGGVVERECLQSTLGKASSAKCGKVSSGYRKLWSLVNTVKRGQSVCAADNVSVSFWATVPAATVHWVLSPLSQ